MYVASGITDESKLRALCEPAYNARAAVPEFPDILNRWEHDAAAWRDSAKGELDLPYLDEATPGLYDIDLSVSLAPAGKAASTISRTNYREMYYSAAQQLAHGSQFRPRPGPPTGPPGTPGAAARAPHRVHRPSLPAAYTT